MRTAFWVRFVYSYHLDFRVIEHYLEYSFGVAVSGSVLGYSQFFDHENVTPGGIVKRWIDCDYWRVGSNVGVVYGGQVDIWREVLDL